MSCRSCERARLAKPTAGLPQGQLLGALRARAVHLRRPTAAQVGAHTARGSLLARRRCRHAMLLLTYVVSEHLPLRCNAAVCSIPGYGIQSGYFLITPLFDPVRCVRLGPLRCSVRAALTAALRLLVHGGDT